MEQHEREDDNDAVNKQLEKWLPATNSGQIMEGDEDANWIIIGFCLKRILAPVLRNYVKPVISALYDTLKNSNNIHTQSADYLVEYPKPNGYKLNYANINNNKNKRQFDYRVQNEIEFSKLFVSKKMSSYRDIDETFDLSAILSLITNVSDFRLPLQIDARKVREEIRNRWAHPEDSSWNDAQVDEYFTIIQQCIRSLQLPEKEESKLLHHVLELRFHGKEKIRSQASMKAMVHDLVEENLYKQIPQGDSPNCQKCKTVLRRPEAKDDASESVYAGLSSETLKERWVCLIKLYPWFKDEMTDSHARCIASQTLNPDQTEIVCLSKFRRMTVDALFKPVLDNRTIYLGKFLKSLETHWEPSALQNRFKDVQPTPEEIEGCIQLNECLILHGTNRQISGENLCRIEEPDKQTLLPKMKGIKTIDTVNNSFLAGFFFSLRDHDSVCDHLHKFEFDTGATKLFSTMEKCSKQIMPCFCDQLESLEETSEIVRRMELRQKYCHEKRQKGLIASMLERIVSLNAYAQMAFDFDVDGIDFGSIIFRLRPRSLHSWGKLKQECSSGDIINMLNEVYLNETIINSFNINEKRLLITIYSETTVSSKNTAQPTALLKMELISETCFHAAAVASEEDPIRRHLEVFCEELEISDELIKLLQLKELVPPHIKDQLKQTGSRSSEIRCLLENISNPKEGYDVLKEYLRYSNFYIYQLLVESDKHVPRRELVFKCEAQLKQREGDLYSKSVESVPYVWVITNSRSYFEENEVPCMCLPSPTEPQIVYEGTQKQSASDTKEAMPNQQDIQWQSSTNVTDGENNETDTLLTLKDCGASDFQSKGSSQFCFDTNKDLSSGDGVLKEFDVNKVEDEADSALEQEKASVHKAENSHQLDSNQKHPDPSMQMAKSEAVQEPIEEEPLCSIKVAGISKIAFMDTLELYFLSPVKSGGGSIKNIDEHKEDDLAIVTFEDETVARRVLSRHHKLNNEVLSVSPYKPPKPRPAYKNCLLIQGVDPSTTKDTLFNFLESGNGGVLATKLESGEQKGTVIVTFDSEIDFDKLIGYCSRKPLRGRTLELSKVYKSNCIIVSNLKDLTTSESVKFYFENKTRSNGGEVEKVKMLGKSGSCLVFFEDYTVVDNVLKKKHILEDQELTVQIYVENLGKSQEGGRFDNPNIPDAVTVTFIDENIVSFIRRSNSCSKEVETRLNDCFAKVIWPMKGSLVKIECKLTVDEPNCRKLALNWKANAEQKLKDYIDEINLKEFPVSVDCWKKTVTELNEKIRETPDKVRLMFDNINSVVRVVGLKSTVELVSVSVQKVIDYAIAETEKCKARSKKVCKLRPLHIKMLLALRYVREIKKQFKNLQVVISPITNEVTFEGVISDINSAERKMNSKLSSLSVKFIEISQTSKDIFQSKQTEKYITEKLTANNLQGAWEINDLTLTICSTATDITSCVENIHQSVQKRCHPFNTESKQAYTLFQGFIRGIQSKYQGQCNVGISKDNSNVIITARDDIVDKLVEEVDTQMKIISPKSFQFDIESETNGAKGGHRKESTKDPTHKCVTGDSDEIRTKYVLEFDSEKERQLLDLGFKRICAVAKMCDNRWVYTAVGDMSQIKVDALMNSCDKNFSLVGGLGAVLARKGGDKVVKDCKEYVKHKGNLSEGDIFISTGGNLQAIYIVHVCCPQWQDGEQKEDELLRRIIGIALRQISAKKVRSVAIPALGSGYYGFPVRKSSEDIALAVKDFFLEVQESSVVNVYLVDVDSKSVDAFTDAVTNVFDNVQRISKQTDFGTADCEQEGYSSPPRSSPSHGKGASAEFGKIKIDVIKGEIESLMVDIIVDTTAKNLDLRFGAVSKSLLNLGGEKIQQELNSKYPYGLSDNEIAVSSGGCLKCKHILHGWLTNWDGGEKAISAIQNFMCNCLKTADILQATSIAFPAIGTGQLGYPCDIVAKEMFSAVRSFERDHPVTSLRETKFVIYHLDSSTLKAFEMEQGRVARAIIN